MDSEVALNLLKIGHLVNCQIKPSSAQSCGFHIVLIAQEGQGGEESILEDGKGRKVVFASTLDARIKAQKIGFDDRQIQIFE